MFKAVQRRARLWSALLACGLAFASFPATSQAATLEASPGDAEWGEPITLTGQDFGEEEGLAYVGQTRASIVEWNQDLVKVLTPSGVDPGDYLVEVELNDQSKFTSSNEVRIHNYLTPKDSTTILPGKVLFGVTAEMDALDVSSKFDLHSVVSLNEPIQSLLLKRPSLLFFETDVEQDTETETILALAADPLVKWAEPVFGAGLAAQPNDEYYSSQWGLSKINASDGWDYSKGYFAAEVGIVDSGVQASHPDLSGRVMLQRDYSGTGVADQCGHGTHVGGIAGASTNNQIGVAGTGWNISLNSYKVTWNDCFAPGTSTWSNWVANAINQAVTDGNEVINLSVRRSGPCPGIVNNAITGATNNGRLVIVAAGNESVNASTVFPANCPNSFVVAASSAGDTLTAFSNFGATVDLSAPGEAIWSTAVVGAPACGGAGIEYAYCDGTSMAAPFVSGAAALLYAVGASRSEVISYMQSQADPMACAPGTCGAGRLNIGKALQAWELAKWQPPVPDWEPQYGALNSAPDASSWGSNRIDVVIQGTDQLLWHKWWGGSSWSDWENLGAPCIPLSCRIKYAPTAVSWGSNRIDVFAVGPDDALWHKYWNGGSWSGWDSLGAPCLLLCQVTMGADASSWGFNRLDVFAIGPDNAVWHKWWGGSSWSGWLPLSGTAASEPGAASWGFNRIDVFIRGTDNALWQKYWNGSGWSDWSRLDGTIVSGPDVASWSADRLDVFAQGADGTLIRKWWDGVSWSHWDSLGGQLSASPGVSSWGTLRVDVFVRGAAPYEMWHRWRSP